MDHGQKMETKEGKRGRERGRGEKRFLKPRWRVRVCIECIDCIIERWWLTNRGA